MFLGTMPAVTFTAAVISQSLTWDEMLTDADMGRSIDKRTYVCRVNDIMQIVLSV